jgi:putative toxin-antitoxin system antitoxin component (TIGR02293 family)
VPAGRGSAKKILTGSRRASFNASSPLDPPGQKTRSADEGRSARIARLLSIGEPEKMTEVALARAVGEGLPTMVLDGLTIWAGKPGELHDVVPEATLRRARAAGKPLSREYSERIYELSRVFEAAMRAYGDDRESALAFLCRPHFLLEMERPIDLAQVSSAGADAVISVIEGAQAGGAV